MIHVFDDVINDDVDDYGSKKGNARIIFFEFYKSNGIIEG
jgi:hypothetical protein